MTIRPARAGDAAGIAAVNVQTWQAAYRGVMPDTYLDALDVTRYERGWERWLADGSARTSVLVAETSDGRITGYVHLLPCRDPDADPARTGEVTSIYVSPSAWGTGTGRALMAAAVRAARAFGFADATLWVLADNSRARRFYASAGWSPDGATKDDDIAGTAVTEVRYRRTLEDPRPEAGTETPSGLR